MPKRLILRSNDLIVAPAPRKRGVGPMPAAMRRLLRNGVAIADAERLDDDELAVTFLNGSRDDAEVRERIRSWAELVGFRRLWLPGAYLPLDPAARELHDVRVRCGTCAAVFEDGGPDFWAMVRTSKLFPSTCLCCGGVLPQWRPVPSAVGAGHGVAPPGRRRTVRSQ